MKHVKICTVVTGSNRDEFLSNLEKIQDLSNCIELRIDYIADLTKDDVKTIKDKTKKEAIVTCRSKAEGGIFTGSEDQRIEILQTAMDAGFDHIDIELATLEAHQFEKNDDTKLIISYHNFTETPKYWKLHPIMNKMYKYEPDVVKIATKVKTDNDVHTLFRLIVDKDNDDQWIIVGMGDEGKITRVLSPILGSYLTYAATPFSESADGQIQLDELKKIYDDLHVSY
jgi:3-dehydroquinate dehydratase-1